MRRGEERRAASVRPHTPLRRSASPRPPDAVCSHERKLLFLPLSPPSALLDAFPDPLSLGVTPGLDCPALDPTSVG